MQQDEAAKLEHDMEERHAEELTALEQREKDAAAPEEEKTSILNTDLYSFSLPPAETQKNVRRNPHVAQLSVALQSNGLQASVGMHQNQCSKTLEQCLLFVH